MNNRNTHAVVPRRREGDGINTFRELLYKLEKDRPDVQFLVFSIMEVEKKL